MAIIEADDHHAEVQQVGDDREEGGLLAAVLGGGRAERRADLAVEGAGGPESAGLVEEVGHLRGHPPEPGAHADDDRVVVGEILDRGDGRALVQLVIGGAGDLFRHELGDALDVHLGALDGAGAFGDRFGHGLDMAIGRIVENQNLGHGRLRN